jgi:hypothetical protein
MDAGKMLFPRCAKNPKKSIKNESSDDEDDIRMFAKDPFKKKGPAQQGPERGGPFLAPIQFQRHTPKSLMQRMTRVELRKN